MKLFLQILFLLLTWFTNLSATPVFTKVAILSYELSYPKTEDVEDEFIVKIGVQNFARSGISKNSFSQKENAGKAVPLTLLNDYNQYVNKYDTECAFFLGMEYLAMYAETVFEPIVIANAIGKIQKLAKTYKTFKGPKGSIDDLLKKNSAGVQGAGNLDDLVSWASKNGLSNLTRTELDDIFKFVDNNFDFAKRVANSTKEIQSATTLTELAGKLNLPITPAAKSLTPYQTRVWYSWRKAKISDMIDKTQTLENQAKQAVNMRNEIRSSARQAMKDSDIADYLDAKELNKTWEQLVQEKIDKGFSGDTIYEEIISSSMKGRPTVDNVFKIPSVK